MPRRAQQNDSIFSPLSRQNKTVPLVIESEIRVGDPCLEIEFRPTHPLDGTCRPLDHVFTQYRRNLYQGTKGGQGEKAKKI